MKILYVEDELSKNISRIIRLFSDYLGKKQRKLLEALVENESGFRIDPQEIKNIVESTHVIEVEWRFPEALQKIIYHPNKYDLFIIDRNLSEQDYDYEEVEAIDHSYDQDRYDQFLQREGDYFLYKLVLDYKVDVITKFYFLTAYSAADEIRESSDIKTFIDLVNFKNANFIEKGNNTDLERLQSVMKNNKAINLRARNALYVSILENYIGQESVEVFLKIVSRKDNDNIDEVSNNLASIRNIYENILRECAERIPGMKESECFDQQYGDIILGGKTIGWLKNQQHINDIRDRLFFSLQKIASKYGSHRNLAGDKPTIEAINAVVYQLKDMIVWLNDICNKHPK